jgi:hypothetical protein
VSDDDDLRALVDALPDAAAGILRPPRGYVVKARPDAGRAATLGTDLPALDAWVVAQGGQLRTARAPASGGLRPGRRVAPPPAAPQRVYVLPAGALAG